MTRVAILAVAFVVLGVSAFSQDPIKVASNNYSVVLENDQVRVLKAVLKPGEKMAPHDHPANVIVPLTTSTARFTVKGGKPQEQTLTAGTAVYGPAENHAVENIGKTTAEVIVIELKGRK